MATNQPNGIAIDTSDLVPDITGLDSLDIADQNDIKTIQSGDIRPVKGGTGDNGENGADDKPDDDENSAPLPAIRAGGEAGPEPKPEGKAKPEYRLVDRDAYRQLLAARKLYDNPQAMITRIRTCIATTLTGNDNDDALTRITAQTRLATLIEQHADLIYENAWHLLYDNVADDIRAGLDQLLTMAATELLSNPMTLDKLIAKRVDAVRDTVETQLRPRIEAEVKAKRKAESDERAKGNAGEDTKDTPSGIPASVTRTTAHLDGMPGSSHGSMPPIDRDSPTLHR